MLFPRALAMTSRASPSTSWLRNVSGLSTLRNPLDTAEAIILGNLNGRSLPGKAARALSTTSVSLQQQQQARLQAREDYGDVADLEALAAAVRSQRVPISRQSLEVPEDQDELFDVSETEAAAKSSVPISEFPISQKTKDILKREKGIEGLFPIQAATFEAAFAGKDVVGRAKTGTGKTLAFALPLVERLLQSPSRLERGRGPRILVMAPTRELARQISAEFELICRPQGLSVVAVYGGSPFGPQEGAFRFGVDVAVGTPGRLIDHIGRGTLRLSDIQSFVMDEADMMLDMGFVEDMDEVIKAVKDARADTTKELQTLLFSATFPDWVRKISNRFLRNGKTETIDLVGNTEAKMADTVKHYAIPIAPQASMDNITARAQALADAVRSFSKKDRTIVFANTKREVDLVVDALQGRFASVVGCRVAGIHGDIDQGRRDEILRCFRDGSVPIMVATDVAARGLDIPRTNLVVHFTPPGNQESFVHRSGRTGRANMAGTSITLFAPRTNEERMLSGLARFAGINFVQTVVQPRDVMAEVAKDAMDKIIGVSANAAKYYEAFAKKILEEKAEGDPIKALSMAIAAVIDSSHQHKHAAVGPVHTRSVLSGRDGYTTLIAMNCTELASLRAALDKANLPLNVRGAILSSAQLNVKDRKPVGVVIEVPSDVSDDVIDKLEALGVEEVEEIEGRVQSLIRGYSADDDQGLFRRGGGYSRGGSRFGGGSRRDDKRLTEHTWGRDRPGKSEREGWSRDRESSWGSGGGSRGGRRDFGPKTSVRWMSIYSRRV